MPEARAARLAELKDQYYRLSSEGKATVPGSLEGEAVQAQWATSAGERNNCSSPQQMRLTAGHPAGQKVGLLI